MGSEAVTEATQYLSFNLEGEEFALEISRVREVLELTKITRVPRTPSFMKGVINLRGAVVPVVDLKEKFGMGSTEKSVLTRIIICEIAIEESMTVIGALADSVHEVMDIEAKDIEPAPKIGTRLDTDFLKGMGKRDNDFILILDIDEIFTADEIMLVSQAGSAGGAEAAPEGAAALEMQA
jgi:purine-binding chemotaxis protein CheW